MAPQSPFSTRRPLWVTIILFVLALQVVRVICALVEPYLWILPLLIILLLVVEGVRLFRARRRARLAASDDVTSLKRRVDHD